MDVDIYIWRPPSHYCSHQPKATSIQGHEWSLNKNPECYYEALGLILPLSAFRAPVPPPDPDQQPAGHHQQLRQLHHLLHLRTQVQEDIPEPGVQRGAGQGPAQTRWSLATRVYTWASISLHVCIRVSSGGLLRFHSQHKMSHQQEHSHVSLQLAATQPGDTRWEYSVTRVTCHTHVSCQQPPDGPDAAGAGRGAAEGGAGEQLQLRGGGVRPLPRGQCSPIVTSIYVTPSLFSSLQKLNIAFALGNLFIETIIFLWWYYCQQIYSFMSGFGSLQIK